MQEIVLFKGIDVLEDETGTLLVGADSPKKGDAKTSKPSKKVKETKSKGSGVKYVGGDGNSRKFSESHPPLFRFIPKR